MNKYSKGTIGTYASPSGVPVRVMILRQNPAGGSLSVKIIDVNDPAKGRSVNIQPYEFKPEGM